MNGPLIGNPQDVLTTPYGYSGQMAPETAIQEQALNRRRLIANMLMQKGMQQGPGGKMVGRFYVADSPLQGGANLASTFAGVLGARAIDNEQNDVMGKDRQMVDDAIKAHQDKSKPQQFQSPAESSGIPPGVANVAAAMPTGPEQGGTLPPRPDGPYSGQVGAAAMPDEGVQSAQPPIPTQPPGLPDVGNQQIPYVGMNQAAPADMSQLAPPPGPDPVTQGQPLPSPQAPAPTSPPVRMVEPPAPPKPTMNDLADLLTHQHPQVRAYGAMLAQQMQKEKEMAATERHRQEDFGYKKYEHETPSANALEATKVSGNNAIMAHEDRKALMDQNQRNDAQMMGLRRDQFESTDAYNKAKLDLDKQQASDRLRLDRDELGVKKQQLEMGKTPPGYRKTADGALEAIPGGPADTKLQGVFNQDTSMLQNSNAGFDRLASSVNELMNHPGIAGITGVRGKVPDVPGTDAANARALLATIKSQVGFGVLQEMRNNSKTGGALGSVSNEEGKRLENNLAALDTTQGADQFKRQLKNILDYTDSAKGRLRDTFNMKHKTGEPVPMSPSTGKGPSVGAVDGGYRFKGGDPAKPESWEKVN